MKDYDITIGSQDTPFHIGFIPGSEKVFFLKTGQGGSIYGYENKYLELARSLNNKFGCSVFVSSTLIDTKESYDRDMNTISELLGTSSYDLFYMGVSKGGLIGCWYGADNPQLNRLLTVNAPLMINFHNRTLPAIKMLGPERLTMVYGSLDPSYRFVGFADRYATVKIINGADHQLKGFSAMYETLAIDLLTGEKQSPPSSDQI